MRLIVHAPNVHQGGGRTLLVALLESLEKVPECVLILDRRLDADDALPPHAYVHTILPTLRHRLMAEIHLCRITRPGDRILCMGNLPPLFALAGHVSVFLQNRYLVDDAELRHFPPMTRLRMTLERNWLNARVHRADRIIVQTPSMQRLVSRRWCVPVDVHSFVDGPIYYPRQGGTSKRRQPTDYDFLYVATADPHKNHLNLIRAWELLATKGLRPSLALTLDPDHDRDLWALIDASRSAHDLKVTAVGRRPRIEMAALYRASGALIYPSTLETVGLPLVEARQEGLPILAGELDYVRDVIDPEETFDPGSPVSIARAVTRHLGLRTPPLTMTTAQSFVDAIMCETFPTGPQM